MKTLPGLALLLLLALSLAGLGCDDDPQKHGNNVNNLNNDGGVDGDVDDGDVVDGDIDDDVPQSDCLQARGAPFPAAGTWNDGPYVASVTASGEPCARQFVHSTTQPRRDDLPGNPRTYAEPAGGPSVSTGNPLFDALYALAVTETGECSVSAIQDYAYNGGNPIACPVGGCFETGRLWKFVWTRDTAYAVDLGLAALDPRRSRNSLEFKVSDRRTGADPQIIQDTGSGGSYPVSTDRAVWAIGARRLIDFLDGDERDDFVDRAWEAVRNTLEQDRVAVFDETNGLYLGEQSFLDWRQQTYPRWTATDTVQIHMSQALSTNVGHLRLLELGVQLADLHGDAVAAARYRGWAGDLRAAIDAVFFHEDFGLWGTFTPGTLDRAPARHFDLLGSALAVLSDVGAPSRRAEVVRRYPHLPQGPAVIWPQQKEIPVYHNRGIWPFVTAYWLRAARAVGNDAAVTHAVHSLMRGAAMNLSNLENFEAVTGAPWLDDGAYSGPVVNSQRQLWSVAGYLSLVQDVIFGLETTPDGIRFSPYLTRSLRNRMFTGAGSLVLNRLPYRGVTLTVEVLLPAADSREHGAYTVGEVRLNGAVVGHDFLPRASLLPHNHVVITLADDGGDTGDTITVETDTSEYRNLFAPLSPSITGLAPAVGGGLEVTFSGGGEPAAELVFHVYRDGVRIATGLPGSATSFIDLDAPHLTRSPCYTVEAQFVTVGALGAGAVSQRARPWCWWGPGYDRITSIQATAFQAVGGTLVNNHGRWHYESWGEPAHTLTVPSFTAAFTGEHLLQVLAGNGAGGFDTGITCVTKRVDVTEGGALVGGGYLVMPHLQTWDDWRDSNFVRVHLEAGHTYSFVIRHDDYSINMSDFLHNALYGGTGGASGAHHYINIAELKILSLSGTP